MQTIIYFKKTVRIAAKEKFWKFIIFAAIIAVIVSMVVGESMFVSYDDTKSGFFAIACASIWIGIFNSIQNICKEHEIIRAEYRSGTKLSAYITANVMWQFIMCLIQTIILLLVSAIFIDYNDTGIIFGSAMFEYFITLFLLTFGSDVMGIMISSISGNPTTAMTIMPFVLIVQLIMSGVLFTLDGWTGAVANITFSKWGMNALGSIADLNGLPLLIGLPHHQDCYERTAQNLLTSWVWCAGITVLFYLLSILSLKLKNRDS